MKLRIGIIGCGRIADFHIAALKRIREVELAAVCDLSEDLAHQMALRHGISRYYLDFSELLYAEKPDIIHITTPPKTHLPLGIQAMEAGCHVLFEKPLALTVEDIDKLAEAATRNKVNLSVVHNVLFLPAMNKAMTMIKSSLIGDLVEMQIIQTEKDTKMILDRAHWCHQLPGGIFGELIPHPLYIAEAFLGDLNLIKVHSRKLGNHEWLKVDELRIMLESNNGTATIICSLNSPNIMFVNFIGTKGCLHVPISRGAVIKHFPSDKLFSKGLDNLSTSYQWVNATASEAIKHIFNQYHDGHYYLIKSFIDALQRGHELPVSLEKARKLTKLYQETTDLIPRS